LDKGGQALKQLISVMTDSEEALLAKRSEDLIAVQRANWVTGTDDRALLNQALQQGADNYLVKGVFYEKSQ
jgi:hypothetical protein